MGGSKLVRALDCRPRWKRRSAPGVDDIDGAEEHEPDIVAERSKLYLVGGVDRRPRLDNDPVLELPSSKHERGGDARILENDRLCAQKECLVSHVRDSDDKKCNAPIGTGFVCDRR